MDRVLVDRLGLQIGDPFTMGTQNFALSAVLVTEPDSATGGFGLGPRTMIRTDDLANSGLLSPGSLYESEYRLMLPPGTDFDVAKATAEDAFRDTGLRWSDSRRATPGVARFVERISSFLVLVGLAGLAVGGVGVSAAVRAYLDGKITTIATLKTLGASGATIFQTYLMQIGILTALGVTMGLILGAGVPLALSPLIKASLPFPVAFGLYPAPLAEAAFYGVTTALLFTLWPLARVQNVRVAVLYRGGAGKVAWPSWPMWLAMGVLIALLIGGAAYLSGLAFLALWAAAGVVASLAILWLAAFALRAAARKLARSGLARGRVGLRAALAAIGGPRDEAASVILSLGLGLTVLAAVGQIDSNLRAAIDRDLPAIAPSYFFVDIQNDQIDGFLTRTRENPSVSKVESSPMLRGVVTQINGVDAQTVAGEHWVVRGDRGVTYSAMVPPGTTLTAGTFWDADYTGPPQLSFAQEEADEIGLKLGDTMTVNILGRDITAEITSLREVDFSTGGMGFVMMLNPASVAGAPHTHIATVYATPDAEAAILRDVATAYPNITAVRVRDAINRVSDALSAIATAIAWAAGATLLTGFVVLIGAAAAGERARVYEAAILKTLGASRAQIMGSFALRAALTGAAAGVVAIAAGSGAAWAVIRFVMETEFVFEPLSALAIVGGGVLATLLAGLAFVWRPLKARPAQVLRASD
jgi:putative ABC transport system permease protein